MNGSMTSKKTAIDIIKVSSAYLIKLLSGVLVGFLLPKIIGVTDYGYYKTFTLYMVYSGLLHFGFVDGILIKYGDKSYADLEKERFRTYSKFVIFQQMIVAFVLSIVALIFFEGELKFIFVCLAVYTFSINVSTYYQDISEITGRFNEFSLVFLISSVITSLSILSLVIIYKIGGQLLTYKPYTIINVGINLCISITYLVRYKELTFGKRLPFKECLSDIKDFFKLGIPLLLSNLSISIMLAIDRQFVLGLFTTETYAVYSFAYNMITLITTTLSGIAVVIYPQMKRADKEYLRVNYHRLVSTVLIIVFICVFSYFPLYYFINWFLPKYIDSLAIFRVLLPGVAFSAVVSIIIHNFYITMEKNVHFLLASLIAIVCSIIANIIAYYAFKTTIAISVASIIVMGIWYLICEIYLKIKFKIKIFKNILYIVCIVSSFYLLTIIEIVWLSMILYLLVLIVISFLFYKNDISSIKKAIFVHKK